MAFFLFVFVGCEVIFGFWFMSVFSELELDASSRGRATPPHSLRCTSMPSTDSLAVLLVASVPAAAAQCMIQNMADSTLNGEYTQTADTCSGLPVWTRAPPGARSTPWYLRARGFGDASNVNCPSCFDPPMWVVSNLPCQPSGQQVLLKAYIYRNTSAFPSEALANDIPGAYWRQWNSSTSQWVQTAMHVACVRGTFLWEASAVTNLAVARPRGKRLVAGHARTGRNHPEARMKRFVGELTRDEFAHWRARTCGDDLHV